MNGSFFPRLNWSSAPIRHRRFMGLLLCALFLCCLTAHSLAATIYLVDGRKISAILRNQTEEVVWIQVSTVQLAIPRKIVLRIDLALNVNMVRAEVASQLLSAELMIKSGDLEKARSYLEARIWELQNIIEAAVASDDPVPEILYINLKQLIEFHLKTILGGVTNHAQQLYVEAQSFLDVIEYTNALPLLMRAANADPLRLDIQLRLAEVANRTNQRDIAINAYMQVLDIDPQPYYDTISGVVLRLLDDQIAASLGQSRPEMALGYFRELVILESDENPDLPFATDYDTFLRRREERSQKSEEEIVFELYANADGKGLLDISLVALNETLKFRPDDEELHSLRNETTFLLEFRGAVKDEDWEQAAYHKATADYEVLRSQRVIDHMARIAGDNLLAIDRHLGDIRARDMFKNAERVFDRGKYEDAIRLIKQFKERYPNSAWDLRADALLRRAEAVIKFERELQRAADLIEAGEIDVAEEILIRVFDEAAGPLGHRAEQLLERIRIEREALNVWSEANQELERENYDRTISLLEKLLARFPETRAGRNAVRWLGETRERAMRRARMNELIARESIVGQGYYLSWWRNRDQAGGGAVIGAERDKALAWFEEVMQEDLAATRETRSFAIYIILPFVLGLGGALALIWRYAPQGRGRLKTPSDTIFEGKGRGSVIAQKDEGVTTCRRCGQKSPEEDDRCQACGEMKHLSTVETLRVQDEERWADYNPWDARVKNLKMNSADEFVEKARILLYSNDDEAISNLDLAIREDPRRKSTYEILADVYERMGRKKKAVECYLEMLLLNPADQTQRLKYEADQRPPVDPDKPLNLSSLIITLSLAMWWLVYWSAVGIFPAYWMTATLPCIAGCFLTVYFWSELQGQNILKVDPQRSEGPDVHHPIPIERLSWRQQARQARMIANKITEHTSVKVPTLAPVRIFYVFMLSIILLITMILLAWINHIPIILIGWPAGVLLFAYLIEIHPRILTAHVLLHHMIQQNCVPWADPHIPFVPRKATPRPKGEFLMQSCDELPVRWALSPNPYPNTRQGVLNSLQQTLNRHWACHRYYLQLKLPRSFRMPMPSGFKRCLAASVMLVIALIAGTAGTHWLNVTRHQLYLEHMERGFNELLVSRTSEATRLFEQATEIYEERSAPHIYAGHALAPREASQAEECFRRAFRVDVRIATSFNDYASFLIHEGRLEDALEWLRGAVRAFPFHADLLNNLAGVYLKLDDLDLAVQYLVQAIDQAPNHPRAYTTLGYTYEKKGQLSRAKEAYRSAVNKAPREVYTQLARDRLASDLDRNDITKLEMVLS